MVFPYQQSSRVHVGLRFLVMQDNLLLRQLLFWELLGLVLKQLQVKGGEVGFRAGTCDVWKESREDPSLSWVGKGYLLEVWFVALERHLFCF